MRESQAGHWLNEPRCQRESGERGITVQPKAHVFTNYIAFIATRGPSISARRSPSKFLGVEFNLVGAGPTGLVEHDELLPGSDSSPHIVREARRTARRNTDG